MNLVADTVAPNLRRAALALHALAPADRDWVFERLGEPQRLALQPLLTELVELGIPPDVQLVRQALARGESGAPPETETQDLDPARLRELLESEPASMRPFLLAVLSEAQRHALQVHGLADTAASAPAMPAALRDSLLRALRQRAGSAGAAA